VKGKPHFVVKNAVAVLGAMEVTIRGGFTGWLMNLLSSLFSTSIKREVENGIKATITEMFHKELNTLIENTPFVQPLPIEEKILIDFLMDKQCFTNSLYLRHGVRGVFYPKENPVPPPLDKPVVLPQQPINDRMGQAFGSDYVINSLTYSFFKIGRLKTTVR
jgi:hypothetical protein